MKVKLLLLLAVGMIVLATASCTDASEVELIEESTEGVTTVESLADESSPYVAARAQERADEYNQEYYEEIMSLDVPDTFSFDERQFFRGIMFDIMWDSGHGRNESLIYMQRGDYCVWTEQLENYLVALGYLVDTRENIVSW